MAAKGRARRKNGKGLGLVNVYSANAWSLRSHVVHNNLHGGDNVSKVHDSQWWIQHNHRLEVYTIVSPCILHIQPCNVSFM